MRALIERVCRTVMFRLAACLLAAATVVSASVVNIAHIAAKDGFPIGLMASPPVLDRQPFENVFDVTMTNLARGYHGTLQDVNERGGIPVAESANETVLLNEMWFNIGADPRTQGANETYWANQIASGAYGVIPVVMVHYTLTAYRAACASTRNCTAISAVLPNIAEYQCTAPLPADCVANHLAVGSLRSPYVVSGLQDANTIGDPFFYAMQAHGVTNIALIGGSALTTAVKTAMLNTLKSAGITCSFTLSWIPTDPTITAATYMSADVIWTLAQNLPVNPPVVQALLFMASAADAPVVTLFMQAFQAFNLNFQAIAVVNGAHAVLQPPWSDYVYATVPWVKDIRELNYDSTTFPGYHVYPTNGTDQMAQVYTKAIGARWPTMPLAYYPICVISSGTTQLVAHAIVAVGRLYPTVDEIKTVIGSVFRPSPNGLLQVDGHLNRVVSNPRILFQIQPLPEGSPSGTPAEFRYQSPDSLKTLQDVFPAPSYDERQPTVAGSFNLVYVPLPVFITVFGAWAAIILQENIQEAAYPIRLSPIAGDDGTTAVYSAKLWVWMVFATLAISLSFWSSLTLAVISIQFSNLFPGHTDITYGTNIIVNWLISAVITFVALLVMLQTVVKTRKSNTDLDTELKEAQGGESHVSNIDSNVLKLAKPYVLPPSDVSGSRWKPLRNYPTFDLRHVGVSMFMAVGTFAVFYLSWSSVHGYVRGSLSSGSAVGYVFAVWALMYLALYSLFHIRVHWLRYSTLATLPSAMLISGYGLASLSQYQQVSTSNSLSTDYNFTQMLLWAVPPTTAILILLVSAVILSLNASRRLLYGVVLKERQASIKEIAARMRDIAAGKFAEYMAKLQTMAVVSIEIDLLAEHPIFKHVWEQTLARKADKRPHQASLAVLPGVIAENPMEAVTTVEYENVPGATLDQLIENDLTYHVMKEIARTRQSADVLTCCKHIVVYRRLKTPNERASLLQFIHAWYLRDDAKYLANIDADLRAKLNTSFGQHQLDPPAEFLDAMKREMFTLARNNVLYAAIRDARPDMFKFMNRWIYAMEQRVKRFDQTTTVGIVLSQVPLIFDQLSMNGQPQAKIEAQIVETSKTTANRAVGSVAHSIVEMPSIEEKAEK